MSTSKLIKQLSLYKKALQRVAAHESKPVLKLAACWQNVLGRRHVHVQPLRHQTCNCELFVYKPKSLNWRPKEGNARPKYIQLKPIADLFYFAVAEKVMVKQEF